MDRGKLSPGKGDHEGSMRVRFLVNKANTSILFMEAGKDLVDMLLAFLQLPAATLLGMFSCYNGTTALKVGCINNIYESLQKLSNASLLVRKETILHPPCAFEPSKESPQLLLPTEPQAPALPPMPAEVFRCSNCSSMQYVSWVPGEKCPSCCYTVEKCTTTPAFLPGASPLAFGSTPAEGYMTVPVSIKGTFPPALAMPRSNTPAQGYVKHYLSFIITNDLSILPASAIESIVLLSRLNVEKMSDLNSFESSVTAEEALELLKVSFTSSEALNNVFGAKISQA